jgi:hypothetical protein
MYSDFFLNNIAISLDLQSRDLAEQRLDLRHLALLPQAETFVLLARQFLFARHERLLRSKEGAAELWSA